MNGPDQAVRVRSSAFAPAVALLCAAILSPAPARGQVPDRAPDRELAGTIADADHQTYRRIGFDLPAGTDRLVVAFDHDGREAKTVIDLGIEDPHGFRGASGGNKPAFTIAETDATPSYLPGRLDPGHWTLTLAVPNIRKGMTARWKARLWFLRGAEAQVLPSPTAGRGPGWYRGDLHLHSAHSDGSCTSQAGRRVPCPLYRTLEAAATRKLDFVAMTEHNTASHAQVLREAQPLFDRLLLIPGREITTFQGHFNVFGIVAPIDFRIARTIDNSFNQIADRVHALGGLVSINHPGLPSGEVCMGCGWTMPGVDPARIDLVEAVNGASTANARGDPEGATSGMGFWLGQLADRPIGAIGGSDNHDPDRDDIGAVGAPVTVVEAADLTQAALFDGMKRGRAFILLHDPGVPVRLDFAIADGNDRRVPMGGSLAARRAGPLRLVPDVAGPPGLQLDVVDGATRLDQLTGERIAQPMTLQLAPGVHALRLRLRDKDDRLLAVSNAVRIVIR